jgi:hypothetical protein
LKTVLFDGTERARRSQIIHGLPPLIKASRDMLVTEDFFSRGPVSIQNMLCIQHPLTHPFHVLKLLSPGVSLCYEQLQTCQFLLANWA